jgi:hypothetical protein
MLTIRKATTEDCNLINELAAKVFPTTYCEILSSEQLEYMFQWMYSPENICKQITENGHVYFISSINDAPCGYVSVEHNVGKFLFEQAVNYIREIHPEPCLMELNVNRNNKAVLFYEHLGMKKLREGDFHIGNGYYMNDYIMDL